MSRVCIWLSHIRISDIYIGPHRVQLSEVHTMNESSHMWMSRVCIWLSHLYIRYMYRASSRAIVWGTHDEWVLSHMWMSRVCIWLSHVYIRPTYRASSQCTCLRYTRRMSHATHVSESCLRMGESYGVATVSRLLKIIGLFCKRALSKRGYSAKETYDFKEPTSRSHPIPHKWMSHIYTRISHVTHGSESRLHVNESCHAYE